MDGLPTQKIETMQRTILIVCSVLPMSALMIAGFMLIQTWDALSWQVDILVAVAGIWSLGCAIAAFIAPAVASRTKMAQLKNEFQADTQPEELAGPLLETIMTSKIIQMSILESAAIASFVMLNPAPSLYLLIIGLVFVVVMLALLPMPGWIEDRFKDLWSELTGKGVF